LGLCALGIFIGYIVTFGLRKITLEAWQNPSAVFSAILPAALGGGLFAFLDFLHKSNEHLGQAVYLYPVGLAYGAICANLIWLTTLNWEEKSKARLGYLFIFAFTVATLLLLAIFLYPPFREPLLALDRLPS
jgi:hypothetical protein